MKNLQLVNNIVSNFSAQVVRRDEKEYISVPIVGLKEGVHCGSCGCLFYSQKQINLISEKIVPLTLQHPQKNGKFVVASEAEEFVAGIFENVRSENGDLKGTGLIDVEIIRSLSPETLQKIRSGAKIEVSTGLECLSDNKPGVWNEEIYQGSAFDIVLDHLALLPDEEGACAIKDGCGTLMNTKKECEVCGFNMNKANMENKISEKWKELEGFCVVDNILVNGTNLALMLNRQIDSLVNEKRTRSNIIQRMAVAADIAVGTVNQILAGSINCPPLARLQGFSRVLNIDISSMVSSAERDGCKYEGVDNSQSFNNKGGIMERSAVVQALIANEKLNFTKDDETWLGELEDAAFNKLAILNDCKCADSEVVVTLQVKNKELSGKLEEMEKALKVNVEAKKAEEEKPPPSFSELLANAEPDVREAIEDGIQANRARKEALIGALMNNDRCDLSKEILENKKIGELQSLVKLGSVPVDYSLKGNGKIPVVNNLPPRAPRMDEKVKN